MLYKVTFTFHRVSHTHMYSYTCLELLEILKITLIGSEVLTGPFKIKNQENAAIILGLSSKSEKVQRRIWPCPTVCDPMDCSLPGFSVHGILQKRKLERVAMPSSREIFLAQGSNSRLMSPALVGRFFTISATWEAPGRIPHGPRNQ